MTQTPPPQGQAAPQTTQSQATQGQVVTLPDGTLSYTHGHRYPDNTLQVTQTHRADGTLQSAHIAWTGFAGKVLDITATFDAAGKVLTETGYRAPTLKDPVAEFIVPLPPRLTATQPTVTAAFTDPLEGLSNASVFGESGGAVAVSPPETQPPAPTYNKESLAQKLAHKVVEALTDNPKKP